MIALAVIGGCVGFGANLILRDSIRIRTHAGRHLVSRRVSDRLKLSKASSRSILEMSDDVFAASLLATLLVSEVAAVVCLCVALAAGLSLGPISLLTLVVFPAVGIAWRLERVEKLAKAKRQSFSYALSSYLNLVSVLLAGGAGSETALIAAATTGNSWSFRILRETLETARASRTPIWSAFAELGRRIGVVDLERIAGSMQLAGEQGARVRVSLAAQAEALRTKQIAEIEAIAQAATERMGVPTVLLFVGFIALLGYPALNLVVGQM